MAEDQSPLEVLLPEGMVPGTWVIDTDHSQAQFMVRHAHVAKVRGTVRITRGTILVGKSLDLSAVSAELDPATVNTDLPARDSHLRSPDFFDVEQFPVWSFLSTAITAGGGDFHVVGDLTIHGVTRAAVLDTEFNGVAIGPNGEERAGFTAVTKLSRKDFGLTWNVEIPGVNLLVSDAVEITIEVVAVKQD
jgi:polyisoprenoid-binding protein YceI